MERDRCLARMRWPHLDLSSARLSTPCNLLRFPLRLYEISLICAYVTDPGFSAPFYRETGRLSSIVLHNARLRSIPQYLFTRRIPVLLLCIWLNVFSLHTVQLY